MGFKQDATLTEVSLSVAMLLAVVWTQVLAAAPAAVLGDADKPRFLCRRKCTGMACPVVGASWSSVPFRMRSSTAYDVPSTFCTLNPNISKVRGHVTTAP